jgi:hypothetical protein
MDGLKSGIVYIDVGWIRARDVQRGFETDEPEVSVCWDLTDHTHPQYPAVRASFETVDDAVSWARKRAPIVLVRLGPTEDQMYSAGERRATHQLAEYGGTDLTPYPEWRPES